MRGETWRSSILVCVMTFSGAWSAAAQTTQTPKWEVEFHGGGLFSTNPTGGTISLPAPGQPFMTVAATPTTSPLPSRYEPSWYFGDGTLLFNQAATALGQLPDQIVPLDSVLAGPLGEHRGGGSAGVRVSRVLTPRVTAELSVDYGFATLRITPANGEAIETTRASFIQAWRGDHLVQQKPCAEQPDVHGHARGRQRPPAVHEWRRQHQSDDEWRAHPVRHGRRWRRQHDR